MRPAVYAAQWQAKRAVRDYKQVQEMNQLLPGLIRPQDKGLESSLGRVKSGGWKKAGMCLAIGAMFLTAVMASGCMEPASQPEPSGYPHISNTRYKTQDKEQNISLSAVDAAGVKIIGASYELPGNVSGKLTALDGAFDSPAEDAYVRLPALNNSGVIKVKVENEKGVAAAAEIFVKIGYPEEDLEPWADFRAMLPASYSSGQMTCYLRFPVYGALIDKISYELIDKTGKVIQSGAADQFSAGEQSCRAELELPISGLVSSEVYKFKWKWEYANDYFVNAPRHIAIEFRPDSVPR